MTIFMSGYRTQRRVLHRNAAVEVRVASPPPFTPDRLALYNRYRSAQSVLHGWQSSSLTPEAYQQEFIHGPVPMTEISVWQNERPLAVLMSDEEPYLLTAVTHFHDPALWRRSIGLFAVLQCFLHAQRVGKKWIYLGYYVPGSPSMGYKKQFQPCELRQWDGTWKRMEAPF